MTRFELWLASALMVTSMASVTAAAPPDCSAWPDCFYPLLDGEDARASRSVGDAVHGFLVAGRRLRESDALGFVPRLRARDLAFGTADLIALIERTADDLRRANGTKLWLGNLSRAGGGDIQHSVSHNSGRDADVAFFYSDQRGAPVDPVELDPVRANGHSAHGLRFDVARNWQFMRTLLSGPDASRVQFVFVASWLKRALLTRAQVTREPAALIARADEVLQHPVGSAAHDDHFHLRIYCSPRDVESGCVDGGDVRSAAPRHPSAVTERIDAAKKQLGVGDSRSRARAIERLVLLRARAEAPAIEPLLDDPVVEVRWAAAAAMGWLGQEQDARAMSERSKRELNPVVKAELALAAQRLHGSAGARLFSFGEKADGYLVRAALYGAKLAEQRLESESADVTELERARARILGATEAAVRVERIEPIEPLLDLLAHQTPRVRSAAARALAIVANYEVSAPWGAADADRAVLAAAAASWRSWIRAHAQAGREGLVSAGFRAARYRYEPRAPQSLYELVRALSGADHHAHNAERMLERLTMHHPPDLAAKVEACEHWREWMIGHRSRFHAGMPVQPVACAN